MSRGPSSITAAGNLPPMIRNAAAKQQLARACEIDPRFHRRMASASAAGNGKPENEPREAQRANCPKRDAPAKTIAMLPITAGAINAPEAPRY